MAVASREQSPPQTRVTLGPVMVRRRCHLPSSLVTDLGSDRVWELAGEWADAEDATSRLGAALADDLSARVPTAPKEVRRELLRARRAAFNSRPLPHGLTVESDGTVAGAAGRYTRALASQDAARGQVGLALEELARRAGAAVDTALGDADLAWSVELSVPGLLAAGRVGVLDAAAKKKARRRALTLLRLVQRAATKPTPFAHLATTHVLFRDGAGTPQRSHLRVDRAAVEWVRRWIAAGGYRSLQPEHLWLTVNPSAMVQEDGSALRVSWLVSRADGTESFSSARCTTALARTLHRLRDPARLSTLAPHGLPDALAELVERGLLEVGPRLPGHGRGTLQAVATATVPAPGIDGEDARLAQQVHDEVCALRDAEHALASGERTGALRSAEAALDGLAGALRHGGRGANRAAVSEDVVGVRSGDGILRTSPEVLDDLGRLQRIVPLLGFELPFQLATGIAFRRRFGSVPVPVPAAYRWFLETGRRESDALLADCGAEELRTVLELRSRLFEGLRAAADRSGAEVTCDPDFLDAVAAELPHAVLDLPCAAWPLQVAGDHVVLNGVGSGYGRFGARVAADLDDARKAELREWAAAADTPQEGGIAVDITALLGATVNEHPLLLPAALGYPGRALECAPRSRIDLSACVVRAVEGRLLLFSDRLGDQPLFPVPHNSTLSTLAPGLYRWLSRLGPPSGATLALWDHVDALVTRESPATVHRIRHYPRLTLGRLVLCRRTWKVPGSVLPEVPAAGSAEGALAWYRWCARTGVPRRSFLRTATVPDPWDVVRGLADKRSVLAARSVSGAAIRKPLYADLSQPLCWPTVPEGTAETLTFTEPLPDPVDVGHGGRVTEYVLETSQPPRASATGGAG